jgi:hypothetical protein
MAAARADTFHSLRPARLGLSISISGNAPPSAGSRWRRFPDFRAVCAWRVGPHSSTSETRSLTWSKFSMTQPGSES